MKHEEIDGCRASTNYPGGILCCSSTGTRSNAITNPGTDPSASTDPGASTHPNAITDPGTDPSASTDPGAGTPTNNLSPSKRQKP